MDRIPNAGPWVTEREVEYVADAARHAWYGNANLYNLRFEQAFAKYVGVRHAVSVPHCTSAIHLALAALGVGPGDEVIVPDITWIATSAPIAYVGAKPVFADVDPVTWCLSADSLAECITPRTKAIIPVDLYGGVPDWDAILSVAQGKGIAVIEDAAEAMGSEYHGRKAGSFGDAAVFSFHGSKTLTTGEGGMLVTNRDDLLDRVKVLRDHGRSPEQGHLFYNTEVAFKYKMSSLQAAFGLAQLERIDELVARKRQIFGWYREAFESLPELTLNAEPAGTKNSFWMTNVLLPESVGLRKEDIAPRFAAAAIDYRPFFHPLSSLPAYAPEPQAEWARARNQVAYRLAPRGVNLPSPMNLDRADVARVSRVVADALADARASANPRSHS